VALILGFLYCIDRNELLSGLLLGLLCYKPQFAFYCLIAVIAAEKLNCLWSALTTLVTLVIGTLLMWGPHLWASYFALIREFQELSLFSGWVNTAAVQPTVFSFLRLTGFNPRTALTLQYIVSMAMGGVVYAVWRKRSAQDYLANSILGCCILLGVPYYIQYDTLVAIIPLAYYWQYEQEETNAGRNRNHDGLMLSLWSMPVLASRIVKLTKIQVVPIICSVVLFRILAEFRRVNSAAYRPGGTRVGCGTERSGPRSPSARER
jgi:hypothetical protein